MKQVCTCLAVAIILGLPTYVSAQAADPDPCITCHGLVTPGMAKQWRDSKHSGVGVGCIDCHQAHEGDPSGRAHNPQHEIYEESKHGNIYATNGESWNWSAPVNEWGPEDIDAPTCATCHMSGFGGAVQTTHNVGERLYWELQPKKSVPQWKGPDEVDLIPERIPDLAKAEKGREEMLLVCYQCHSSQWADNYFDEFDKVVEDYNKVWAHTDGLLQDAYAEGLISKDNPLDETPEIMHYLVWHHDGRRWRMGASMMGPDWTHWNGAVDAIMNKLGTMINDLETRRKLKTIEEKLDLLLQAGGQ